MTIEAQLFDGSILEFPDGTDPSVIQRVVKEQTLTRKKQTAPAAQPESGFLPAFKAGATELGGSLSALAGKIGLKDEAKAAEEYEAAKKKAQEIFKPTEEGWTQAPLTKFGELLGGSLPYMAAPLAAGAAAGALPLTGLAATAAGLGAAGLTSAGQFTATNLARQMDEGKKLEDTSVGAAALAAIPQAALDTLSMRMIPGIGRMFGQAGVKVTAETAKDIAEQGLKKTLADYALTTGKTAGVEGMTEAAQQVFERLQAGLNITDEKARQEYFDNFIGGAVLGGTLSVPGRFIERGRQQREARDVLREQETAQRRAEAQAEEDRKKDPAYLMQVSQEYAALEAQKKDLQNQIIKGTKEQPLDEAARQTNKDINAQLAALAPDLREKAIEFNKLGGKNAVAKLEEQQRVAALSPLEYQMEQMGIKPSAPPTEAPATPEEAAALRGEAPEAIAPEVSYAQTQLDFAKRQGAIQALDPDEQRNLNVAFLMQDPAMAQQLLKERPALPDMNRKERDTIFSALALQLGTGRQVTPGSLADVMGIERETRAAAQAALEEKLGKEREALERIKATPEYLRGATQETVTARAEDAQRAELSRQLTAPVQEQRNLFADTEVANVPAAPSLAETVAKTLQQPLPPLDQAIMGQYANVPGAKVEAPEAVTRTFVKAPDKIKLAEVINTALQKDIPANDRALLEKLDANIDAYARDPAAVESAVDFIYKRLLLPSQGMPFTQKETIDPAKDIKERLQLLDQAKLSETEQATQLARRRLTEEEQQSLYGTSLGPRAQTGVVEGELGKTVADFTKQAKIGTPVREATDEILRAVQGELPFTDRRGEPVAQTATSFGNWKEFQNYLSSEGLQMLRAAQADLMGTATPQVSQINKPQTEAMVRQPVKLGAYPNVHRASVLVRDMLNRAEEVRQKVSALAAERQALVAQPERDATASQQLLNEAKAALTKLTSTDVWETTKGEGPAETRYAGKWDTALLNRVQAAKTKVDAAQRMRDQLMAQVQSNLDSFTNQVNEYEKATAPTVTDKDALMLQYEAQGEKARGAAKKAALTARDQLKGTVDNLIAHQRWLANAQKAVNFIDDSTPPAEKAFRLRKLNELLGIEKQLRNTVTQQYNQFMGQVQQSFAAPNLKPSLPDRTFKNFLVEEAKLTDLINQNNRALGGLKLNLYNAKTALNQAYVAAEQSKAEDLLKVRNNLLAAEKLDREMRAVLTERREQANAPELVQPQQALTAEAGQLETKARKAQRASQRLAAAARPTNVGVGETQAQREARDAQARREEQARLERMEEPVAGPVTEPAGVYAEKGLGAQQKEGTPVQREQILMGVRRSIRQEIQDKTDKLAALREIAEDPDSTLDERVEATNEFAKLYKESHGKLERLDARIGNALKKQDAIVAKIKEVRDTLAQPSVLTDKQQERYKNKPEELETREANQRDKLQTQLATLFTELNKATTFLSEKRGIERVVVPTKAERAAPREIEEELTPAGERIAQTQTTSRQTGPLTKRGTVPPTQLRTGSAESRTGVTEARTRNVPQEPGKFADALIAKLSKVRTQLDTVKEQLKFIEANPSKTAEGAAKQEASKKRLTEEQQTLEKQLAELRGEQAKVSAEEAKVQAELRKGEEVPQRGEKEFDLRAGDVELSRGATVNPSTTGTVRTELKKAFPDLGRVQIYDSVDALIKDNPQYEDKIPSDARGFVDSAGNKAFLIAENINEGQALSVLLHEVGSHIGLKNTLGEAQYNALVKAVDTWAKKDDGSVESRVAKAALDRVEAAKTKPSQRADETLAYAIEEAVNAGVKPMETKGPIGQWLGRIAQAFRKTLEKFGLPPKALDAQALVDMAFGAAKVEMTPVVPQMSRRQFLRGAGAALGTVQLPPLSKEMSLRALRSAFEGSLNARGAWFDALKTAVKNKGLGRVLDQYEDVYEGDNALVNFTQSDALKGFLQRITYDENYQNDGYDYYLNELLSGKDGLKVVADLQQALRAQGASLVEAAQKTAKEKGLPEVGELFFARAPAYAPGMEDAGRVADKVLATPKSFIERVKPNLIGLGFRTQFIDKLAPIEQVARGMADAVKASQMMYYLRMYDQRMNFTSQAVGYGAPQLVEKTRKDGQKERVLEATKGANIKDIVKLLSTKEVKEAAGSPDAANRLFTLYLAAKRADRVGLNALNFGGEITQADLDAAVKQVEDNAVLSKAFKDARDLYNEYNRDLIKFAVQTGAINESLGKRLVASDDYIPYYRVREGNAELMIGGETPIRIGNLKDSPHLQELVGGTEKIMNFLDSSVQNTSMLLDMSLRNVAIKNSMFELNALGLVTAPKPAPKSGAPAGAITFKKEGVEYYVLPKEDKLKDVGIPADLLVKGLEGIPTMFPQFMRIMGMPSRFLRRAVVASPVYMARQLFRDSLSAYMMSGSDATPVLGALKQIGKESVLERRGVTGGQVFTGMPEDMSRLLREMQEGRPGWSKALSKLEAMSMEADAATRKAQYESYLKQGLSEMEATLMSLESMNFSRRGLSPSVHMATTLVPFMNAQIQSLDVMYRAFRGQMPFNDRLALRERMITTGLMLAAMSMAYASAMQDDDTYKNARPDEKYGNWFVKIPGVEQAVRVPIPFELGYIFKALPEAIVNTMTSKHGGEEAVEAFKGIARQLVPGGTSYGIPQAVKPLIEVGLGKSFYTGRDIESAKEQAQMPGTRYRDNTSEAAKYVGSALNISPIKLEALINGYTGSMGLALLQSLNVMLPDTGPEKAAKRLSDMPVVGTLFQPEDSGGIIDATYKALQEATQAHASYKALVDRGEYGKAQALIQGKLDEMSLNAIAGKFKQQMGQFAKAEQAIRASNLSPEEKRKSLDVIRQIRIGIASSVRTVVDKTKSPEVPA